MPLTIRFEPIPPRRPNYPLDVMDKLEAEVSNALNGPIKDRLEKAFEKRVAGWKDRPDFKSKMSRRASALGLTGFSLTVGPFGKNKRLWVFVSTGTIPHPIDPVRAKVLGPIQSYDPRTAPGGKFGGSGTYSGEPGFAHHVDHPGIKARGFERDIVDDEKGFIVATLAEAIRRATA